MSKTQVVARPPRAKGRGVAQIRRNRVRLFAVQTKTGIKLVALNSMQATMLKTHRLHSKGGELLSDFGNSSALMTVPEYEIVEAAGKGLRLRRRKELTLQPWTVGRVDRFPVD